MFYTKRCFTQKPCYTQTPCFTQKSCSCWACASAVCGLQDSYFHGGRRNTPKAGIINKRNTYVMCMYIYIYIVYRYNICIIYTEHSLETMQTKSKGDQSRVGSNKNSIESCRKTNLVADNSIFDASLICLAPHVLATFFPVTGPLKQQKHGPQDPSSSSLTMTQKYKTTIVS